MILQNLFQAPMMNSMIESCIVALREREETSNSKEVGGGDGRY